MAARIVHVPADAPVIAIYKSGILPEHEGYKYFVPARTQSEDQRRRRVKHQLAVDQPSFILATLRKACWV